jgi:hypothetical protein
MRLLLAAAFLSSACVCAPAASTATTTPSPTATASPTPSLTPSRSPSPLPLQSVYVSAAGGYRIATPPPLRRSDCLSARPAAASETLALDTFVAIAEADEQFSDVGFAFDQIIVQALRNTQLVTPRQWVDSGKLGASVGMTVDESTLDGRLAVRVRSGPGFVVAYVLADRSVLYVIRYATRDGSTIDQALAERTIATFHILADNERPPVSVLSPGPPPPRSADAVAASLVDGFAKKDANALAAVMAACMSQFAESAGGTSMPRSRFAAQLSASFASGLTVSVEPVPLASDQFGSFLRATWTDPGQTPQRRDLYLRDESGRWTWFLVLRRQPIR